MISSTSTPLGDWVTHMVTVLGIWKIGLRMEGGGDGSFGPCKGRGGGLATPDAQIVALR